MSSTTPRPTVLRAGTVLTVDSAHTVLDGHDVLVVDGRIAAVGVDLAGAHRAVQATVDYLRGEIGEPGWREGMNPEIPETKVLDNPYTYTDYRSAATHRDPGSEG